jgi:hypothetical protein
MFWHHLFGQRVAVVQCRQRHSDDEAGQAGDGQRADAIPEINAVSTKRRPGSRPCARRSKGQASEGVVCRSERIDGESSRPVRPRRCIF